MYLPIDNPIKHAYNSLMIEEILTSLGLTPEQVDIYQSLLTNGSQTATKLAKTTKVQRTYIYRVAQELVAKGLVAMDKKDRTTVFVPQSPDHLLTQAEEVKTKAIQAQTALEGILPSLKTKYQAIEAKPTVTYYEGVEGIKKVYMDTIKEGKPILAMVETSKVEPDIYEWITKEYVKLRVEAKIPVKAIVASGQKTQSYERQNDAELRETKRIDSEKFPFEHEINIYGTKLAIINHRKGTTLMGIIIDNPVVAKTFKSWFELTWLNLS